MVSFGKFPLVGGGVCVCGVGGSVCGWVGGGIGGSVGGGAGAFAIPFWHLRRFWRSVTTHFRAIPGAPLPAPTHRCFGAVGSSVVVVVVLVIVVMVAVVFWFACT